jgi:urea carboxylase
VHILEGKLRAASLPGIIDITPGVRSLHIHYDNRRLRSRRAHRRARCDRPDDAGTPDITVPSRIVHLPLSWDDPAGSWRRPSTCRRCGPTPLVSR